MRAAGFLGAVKCAVRCTPRSVLVVVHPAWAVRSYVVVSLLCPKATMFFREVNETRASTSIHPMHRI